MAEKLVSKTIREVGTTAIAVEGYSVPAGGAILIGLSIANITTIEVSATLYRTDNTNITHIIKEAPIPPGGTLSPSGFKMTVNQGEQIFVQSNNPQSLDVTLSLVEMGVSV